MSKLSTAKLSVVLALLALACAAFGAGTARAECGEEGSEELAFQGSGKILVALCGPSRQAAVLRLDGAGQLDPTFAEDGSLGPWPSAFSPHVAVTQDDKLLVQMRLAQGRRVVLRRFSADGRLDRSFAGGNAPVPSNRNRSLPHQIRVFSQPQGTSVVAYVGEDDGCFGGFCAERTTFLRLFRYSATGRRIAEVTRYSESWSLSNITMAPDGDILAAGEEGEYWTLTYLRTKPNLKARTARKVPEAFDSGNSKIFPGPGKSVLLSGQEGAIGRYRPDWSLDESFGEAGFARCGPKDAYLEPLASLPSGGFLAQGSSAPCGLMRYQADGRPDPTFGTGGSVDLGALGLIPSRYRLESLAIGPTGQIAIAFGNEDKPIVRVSLFSPDGQLETGFGSNGVVTIRNFQAG
ncbi:MAG TPA: hypothetical protein VJL81_09930 [Solirubrobacterales bacterium]|nr:hypothetical protein [Solirubrobacterales bacterium]